MSVQEATALKLITGECSESEVMSYKEDANCTPLPSLQGGRPGLEAGLGQVLPVSRSGETPALQGSQRDAPTTSFLSGP